MLDSIEAKKTQETSRPLIEFYNYLGEYNVRQLLDIGEVSIVIDPRKKIKHLSLNINDLKVGDIFYYTNLNSLRTNILIEDIKPANEGKLKFDLKVLD